MRELDTERVLRARDDRKVGPSPSVKGDQRISWPFIELLVNDWDCGSPHGARRSNLQNRIRGRRAGSFSCEALTRFHGQGDPGSASADTAIRGLSSRLEG